MLKMFEPADIGSMHLRNRLFMCPMGTGLDETGHMSKSAIPYFEERAKGVGMVAVGFSICPDFGDAPSCPIFRFSDIEMVHELIDHVHNQGAKFCAELVPGMGRTSFNTSVPIYSSSDTPAFWNPSVKCIPYTKEQIQVLVKAMATSATFAMMAGADAIEIHAYGGYLVDQFLTPLWNTRTDEYGGSFENRMRFLLELVGAARAATGPKMPIIVKFTPDHGITGGRELADGIKIAKKLEEAGVTALHVDKGCYERWYDAIDTVYEPEAHQLDLCAAVSAAVSIPVLGQGKLWDPAVAEAALEDGKLSFVGLGHQIIADPEWPQKVKEGRTFDIAHCIGCNECLNAAFVGARFRCAINPHCYHEMEYVLTPGDSSKRVLVVGGGVGGMNAAITAARRGFKVELWEKSNELGGNLRYAGAPAFKTDVKRYAEYLKLQLLRSGAVVRMMKDASAEEIIAAGFDKVILATGSLPILPSIPGANGKNVKCFTEVMTNVKCVGKRAVVIGGGHVGCETAIHLKQSGVEHVTIVEKLDDILKTSQFAANVLLKLRSMVAENGIEVITEVDVQEIEPDGIVYKKNGELKKIECDTTVIAAGLRSNNPLESAIEGKVNNVSVIGDAVSARKIITAVSEGYHAARCF